MKIKNIMVKQTKNILLGGGGGKLMGSFWTQLKFYGQANKEPFIGGGGKLIRSFWTQL